MAYIIAPYSVLLIREGKRQKCRGLKIVSVAVAAKKLQTYLNATSLRVKDLLSDLDPVYYYRRRSNNYTDTIMAYLSWRTGSPDAVATFKICRRYWRGVVFTRIGGRSCLL